MPLNFVTELPAKTNRSAVVQETINELANNPGTWAEIASYPKDGTNRAHSSAYVRARYLRNRDSHIETATRTIDGNVTVYARYITS